MSCPPNYIGCSSGSGGCCPAAPSTFCDGGACYLRNGSFWGEQVRVDSTDTITASFRGLSILFSILGLFCAALCWTFWRRSTFFRCATSSRPAPALVLAVPPEANAPPLPPPPPLPTQVLTPDPEHWRAVPVSTKAGSLGILFFDAVEGKGAVVRSLVPSSPLLGKVLPGDRLLQLGEGDAAMSVLTTPFDDVQALLKGGDKRPPTLVFLRHVAVGVGGAAPPPPSLPRTQFV